VQVYLKARTFRGESSLETWLTRITINRCRSLQRRKWLSLDQLWRATREATSSEPVVGHDELESRVRTALQRLPRRQREVIVMYYLEEMSTSQVAAVLHATEGAVNVRLHRARKRLEALLAPSGGRRHA
jgi:RNA polymerase sigma-70 factor (ECF subfamily)